MEYLREGTNMRTVYSTDILHIPHIHCPKTVSHDISILAVACPFRQDVKCSTCYHISAQNVLDCGVL